MIKDFLVSFKDNIKEKTTNPFFGTLTIVWTVKHWKFVYSLFNFDDSATLDTRLTFIETYFKDESFWSYLLSPVLLTFAVIIGSYTLINLSRLIINIFEKKVTPYVYKVTDSSSIVLKQDYLKLKKEIEDLDVRLDKEREQKVKAQTERDSYENKLNGQLAQSLLNPSPTIQESTEKEEVKIESKEDKIINKIKEGGHDKEWTYLTIELEKGNFINFSSSIDFFIKIGLLKVVENYSNSGKFKLTKLGEQVRDKFIERQL